MRSQRRDPYPWTWEPAAATICVLLILGLIAAKAGVTLAAWILGRPTRSIDVLATYNDAAGATMREQTVTLSAIIMVELVTLLLAGWGTFGLARTLGLTGAPGFATSAQARQALGTGRLRRHRRIIRPDLHRASPSEPSQRGARASGNAQRILTIVDPGLTGRCSRLARGRAP